MTSPIDVAYVEVRPDVDNFDRALTKELDSTFRQMEDRAYKSVQKVEQRFDELETELHENFKEIDKTTTSTFTNLNKVVDKTTTDVVQQFDVVGDRIGDNFAGRISDRVDDEFTRVRDSVDETNRRISEDTDRRVTEINDHFGRIGDGVDEDIRDRRGIIETALRDVGNTAGNRLSDGVIDGFSGLFNSEILKTILLGTFLAAIPFVAPLIGTALASAIVAALPLGFIGIAIFSQLDDPALQQAGRGFANSIKDIFDRASEGLVDDLILGLDTILNSFQKMEPTITKIFQAIEPLVQPLAEGIGGFIEGILPGILTAIENSGPLIEEFAQGFADLGAELGDFFAKISEDPEALAGGMRNLFDFIIEVIYWLGELFAFLISVYDAVKGFIKGLGDLFSYLGEFLGAVWDMLTGDLDDFKEFWSIMWEGAYRWVEFIFGKIIEAGFWLKDHLDDIGNGIVNFFKGAWERIRAAWNGAVERVLAIGRGLRDRLLNLANWGMLLFNAGRNIINGLINGIRNAVPGLTATLGWITDLIPDWKGPMEKDRKLLEPTGEAIMGGLDTGIQRGADSLRDTLDTVTNNISLTTSTGAGFGAISVNMIFNGATPSEGDARRLGQAAGRGIQDTLNRRAVRTAVRTA